MAGMILTHHPPSSIRIPLHLLHETPPTPGFQLNSTRIPNPLGISGILQPLISLISQILKRVSYVIFW
jgi:hypothetical protein